MTLKLSPLVTRLPGPLNRIGHSLKEQKSQEGTLGISLRTLPAMRGLQNIKKTLMKSIKFISLKNAFSDYVVHEKLISLNNSYELLALLRKLG